MLIRGVLPLSAETATGDHILMHSVELGYVSVPIHKVFFQSDLVSGYVAVGILPTLLVDGVSFLLENVIAREKVIVNLWLSSLPCLADSSDQVMQDNPGLYPTCAVTRSMAKKAEKLPPLDSDDQAINQSSEKCSALEPTISAENVDNCDDNVNLSTTF